MLLIRQPTGSGLCAACCLGMVTGTSINDVLSKVHLRIDAKTYGHPYVPMREVVQYLQDHGLWYGGPFAFGDGFRVEEGTNDLTSSGTQLTVENIHALVSVRSTRIDGALHMVVWNAHERLIYDPQEDRPQPLSNYEIIEWANLIPINEL